jgi:bacterioferritin-associated ferredoxin
MVVCVCNGITESEIRKYARGGVGTLSELASCAGVGAGCGRCRQAAEAVLKELEQERSRPDAGRLPCSMPA